MAVDLHTHSTASDGSYSPEELVDHASRRQLRALALTDHDTTGGVREAEAAAEAKGIGFVPGIEISADPGRPSGTMHILGYFVEPDHPELKRVTEEQQKARRDRIPRIVDALNRLGIDITLEEVTGGGDCEAIGRPHVAAVLLNKGWVGSMQEAFERYLGDDGAAFQPKARMPAARAIEGIHAAGGLAVLAHPIQLRYDDDAELVRIVEWLVDAGLDGMEVYHPDHTEALADVYRSLADRFGLTTTGGSDFHGSRKEFELGGQNVPDDVYERLRAAVGHGAWGMGHGA